MGAQPVAESENRMPDTVPSHPPAGWLTDRIAWVEHQIEHSFRHEGMGPRLERDAYLRLHFVSVYVRDQEQSKQFFLEQLGFTLITDVHFESGNRWIEVAPPDGTAVLALVRPMPGFNEEGMIGHSGLVTFITEDVDEKYREWSARGVKFTIPPQTPEWGGIFCRFEDLDGNAFALAGFDDLTRAIEERRLALAERLEAERRAAQELDIAKQVQARLFPQRLPVVVSLDYAGVCVQARSVGGDYYDFLRLDDDRLALVIGDVAGKGIAASLLMANLQASLRSQCVGAAEYPQQLLSSVNRLLFENTAENAYVTLFFSDYDPRTGRLRYANCGHLPALIIRSGGAIDRLQPTCTVLGLFEDWQCTLAESHLGEGDLLALYTDGVTESPNAAGEEFGEQRLVDAILHHWHLPARQLAAAVVDQVVSFSAHEQFDDITLIIAKRKTGE
jgi:serine phosphatase RsbU (regulator of sigma subunit)/predicted enzyme related to lactoylglutathione lyase